MSRPDLVRRGMSPASPCVCNLIVAHHRPCLSCRSRRALTTPSPPLPWWRAVTFVERFSVIVALVTWLLVVAGVIRDVWGAP